MRSMFCQSTPRARRPGAIWRWDGARAGGYQHLGCYCIHQVRFVFGVEPVRVFASAQIDGTVDVTALGAAGVSGGERTAG